MIKKKKIPALVKFIQKYVCPIFLECKKSIIGKEVLCYIHYRNLAFIYNTYLYPVFKVSRTKLCGESF